MQLRSRLLSRNRSRYTMFLLLLVWMQDPASQQLADLIDQAHANHGTLAAYHHQAQALDQARVQARALDDPDLMVNLYAASVETRVGPQEASFNLSQKIPYPGLRDARAQLVDRRRHLIDANLAATKADLGRAIALAYFDIYFLQQKKRIDEENLRLITRLEELARARFRTGGGAYAVVIQAQTQLANAAEAINTSEARIQAALADLTSLLGVDEPPVLGEVDIHAPIPDLAGNRQPALAVMDAKVGVFTGQDLINQYDNKPNFKVGVTYIQTGDAINPALPDSGQDAIIASVGINLPIWRDRNRAKARQNLMERDATEARRAQLQRDLQSQAARHRVLLEDTRRQIRLYKNTLIPQALLTLESATQAFRTGAVPFSTLIEVQRDLLAYRQSLARARTDEAQHRVNLAWLGTTKQAEVTP